MKYLSLVFTILLLCHIAPASPRIQVKAGNRAAQAGEADAAMVHYKKALEQKGDSSLVLYDLGNLMYAQGQYDDAAKSYMGSFDPQDPAAAQSATFYNLGNSFFQAQQYDKALASYVEALKRNPKDEEARYNLELARRMMQEQQQQQQQNQQNQDQQQQQQDQEQQNPDQPQDQQDKQQQQDQQPQNPDQPQDEQQQQRQPQPQPDQQMSKEDAERLLNALLQNEQNALRDVRKAQVVTRGKREKDW